MTKMHLEGTTLDVTVKESDRHTKLIHVQFDRDVEPEGIHSKNEMFLTLEQLENLGKFFIRNVDDIRLQQKTRKE